jgi:hypothetical protein
MSTSEPLRWLSPLPISWEAGKFFVRPPRDLTPAVPPIDRTFEQLVNEVHQPRQRIRRRTLEVRRALCATLRHLHHPKYRHRGPWRPEDARYTLFRSTIAPLLAHPIWHNAVIAAPFLLYLRRPPVAGIVDVIIRHPDGSVGVIALHTTRREDHLVDAARAELGGIVAALADHQVVWVNHAITLWAAPGNTEAEYHHPDICLGLWTDAVDLARFESKLKSRRRRNDPAAAHPSADPSRPD